jgi:hypothetical protein
MPSDFEHVTDELVRRILVAQSQQLRTFEVGQAVDRTILALGHDAIREDVPAHAFEARRAAAKEAFVRIKRRQKTGAWRALQRFWLS